MMMMMMMMFMMMMMMMVIMVTIGCASAVPPTSGAVFPTVRSDP